MKKRSLKWLVGLLLAVITVCGLCACSSGLLKLEFETNGGSMEQTVYEVVGGEPFEMPVPTRTGYSFTGWFTERDCSGEAVASTITPETGMKFYAGWEQLYKLTLSIGQGSLPQREFYLKSGENIYNKVKDLVPVLDGCQFGAWYYGDNELSETMGMPQEDLTLTARYKVEYTIEVYLQNLDQTDYERSDDLKGYEYAGKEFTAQPELMGFTVVSHEGEIRTKTISENPSENLFRLYFDRVESNITFFSNYPEGEEERKTVSYLYGTEVDAPYDLFELEGYCFAGWATYREGEVVYHTDYINSRLYEAESESVADKLDIHQDANLFAVWVKGYKDMFGGLDVIFRFDSEPDAVYMLRDRIFFRGEYNADKNLFRFYKDEEILLEGRFIGDKFVYSDEVRADYTCNLYVMGKGLDSSVKIYLDSYNGITYEDREGTSKGTYDIDENGYYISSFTSGRLDGQTLTIRLVTVRYTSGATQPAFQIRNDEEAAYGVLVRFLIRGTDILSYNIPYYTLEFDGFGGAVYSNGQNLYTYAYTSEGDVYTLQSASSGAVFMVIRLLNLNGRNGYLEYNENCDGTYTSGSATLELDGTHHGVYTNGSTVVEGFFSVEEALFGTVITLFDGHQTLTFLTHTTETEPNEEGTTETVRTFELKPNGYAEYYYVSGSTTYYTPYVVLNETEEGKATVYGYTAEGVHKKVATGRYEYDERNQRYTFFGEEFFDAEDILLSPVDLTTVKTFCFGVGTRTLNDGSAIRIAYWYWMTSKEPEEKTDYTTVYNGSNDEKVTIVGNFAVYESGEDVLVGTHSRNGNITVLTFVVDRETRNVYVELNEEDKTFILLHGVIGPAYYSSGDGTLDQNTYLYFDGKDGVEYSVTTVSGEGDEAERTTVTEKGSYRELDETTSFGVPLYEFTGEKGTKFKFLLLYTSQYMCYTRYNETYHGVYTAEGGGELELDGYGFNARYSAPNGEIYEGNYFLEEDGLVRLVVEEGSIYFNLSGNKFTVRGGEYGMYFLVDNQEIKGYYFMFDGYGKMSVYTLKANDDGTVDNTLIDEAGTYEYADGRYKLTYKENNKSVTLFGIRGTITSSDNVFLCIIKEYEEVEYSYLNEVDLSMLVLDGFGNARKYNAKGVLETGVYTIVTDTLLFYMNSAGNDACIYKYNVEKGTATPIKYSARGYFTKDLEAMVFYTYGFMNVNGDTYYYEVEDGNVMIYRRYDADRDRETDANEYGFVKVSFGAFDNEKEFEGKKYFANSGYSILFRRDEADAQKYPVTVRGADGSQTKLPLEQLAFAPTGSGEFSVPGTVIIGERSYDCTVTRQLEADGTAKVYVTVQSFRFEIEVNYTGDSLAAMNNNTYKITEMSSRIQLVSGSYLELMWMIYSIFGGFINLPNSFGDMTLITEFDETGEMTGKYFDAAFGADSGMFDTKGNLIRLEHIPYEISEDGLYTAEYECDDGYTYKMYFIVEESYSRVFGVSGYRVLAFTRLETLTAENGKYEITIERIISSDVYRAGQIYGMPIFTADDKAIETQFVYVGTNIVYFILREESDGKFTTAKYYVLTFTEKTQSEVEGSETIPGIPLYESFSVEIRDVKTYYSEDGTTSVDIEEKDGTGEVVFIAHDTYFYFVSECEYDNAGTYTVTASGRRFTVKVEGEKVTVTEIVEEESEE